MGGFPELEAAIRFVLDPRVEVVSLEGNFVQLRYGDAALSLTCSGNISVEDGLFSPEHSRRARYPRPCLLCGGRLFYDFD